MDSENFVIIIFIRMIARLVSRRALSNVTISDRIATVTLANPPVNLLSRSGPDIKCLKFLHSIMSSRTICRKKGEFTSSRTIFFSAFTSRRTILNFVHEPKTEPTTFFSGSWRTISCRSGRCRGYFRAPFYADAIKTIIIRYRPLLPTIYWPHIN